MDESWHQQLRSAREAADCTQRGLAERAAVSESSVRAYESGRRHPTREALSAILRALAVEPIRRNQILESAGYAPEAGVIGAAPTGPDYTLEEAVAEINTYPWPAHLNNEMFEVLAANPLMQAVWGVDLANERHSALERSFVVAMSEPRFADHIKNWDELMLLISRMLKGSHSEEGIDESGPNPYLATVAQKFLMGDSRYVQRFLQIWISAPPLVQKRRFVAPMQWEHDELGPMKFMMVINPANMESYMTFIEWMPCDGETGVKLDELKRRVAAAGELPRRGTGI